MLDSIVRMGGESNHAMDVAVAQHVMGWEPTNESICPDGAISSNYRSRAWKIPGRGLVSEEYLPKFSGSLVAAWDVVEHLVSKGFSVDVSAYPDRRTWRTPPYEGAHPTDWTLQPTKADERFKCTIYSEETENGEAIGEWVVWAEGLAATAAMAVCLSALKAMEQRRERGGVK